MGVDPVTASLFAASTASNVLGQQSAKKAQKKQYKDVNRIFQELSPEIRQLFAHALRGTSTAYDQAFGLLKGYGKSERSSILARGHQYAAENVDSAISRGLYGTNYLENLQRGTQGDTSRQLQGVDERLAVMLSGLMRERGASLASLYTQEAGALGNLGVGQANALTSFQHTAGPATNLAPWAYLLGGGGQTGLNPLTGMGGIDGAGLF